ncbi:MAG: DUF4194 domain-containing protein [Burkholderiaceae bacterium]|nr:DUF4194 domain-containing protein [Burkholderiaceae bacterium]
MASKKPTLDIFDQWASAAPADGVNKGVGESECEDIAAAVAAATATAATPSATPVALRRAVQELLKNGVLEHSAKPQLFRQIADDTARVNAQLEPLDLEVRVDDVRGLAFVAIAPTYLPEGDDEDEWTHPLMRRQRLTLEQSLLLAILRREFLQREQEGGLGVPVRLAVDSLLPQLEIYLGSTGSDMQERKRLATLLEGLRGHGVVSEVDTQDIITLRPMMVHLANPQNLQALLQHLRTLTAKPSAQTPTTAPEDDK